MIWTYLYLIGFMIMASFGFHQGAGPWTRLAAVLLFASLFIAVVVAAMTGIPMHDLRDAVRDLVGTTP